MLRTIQSILCLTMRLPGNFASARLRQLTIGCIALSTISLGMGGCGSAQNRAIPENGFVVPANSQAIKDWKDAVYTASNCGGVDTKSKADSLKFDPTSGEAIEDEKALCKVIQAIQPRHDVKALLLSDANDRTGRDQEQPSLAREFRDEWPVLGLQEGERPKLGVALSGGGPRSGSFSIGVLKALYESGVLFETEYLSTVSGGGYAAYWYFSQLLNRDAWQGVETSPFSDCYHGNGAAVHADSCLSDHETQFPFQTHLAKHTDLVAETDGRFATHVPEYAVRFYPFVGALLYPLSSFEANFWSLGFLMAIPHHLANTLFDWSWNGSPYGVLYRAGIHQTYGPLQADGSVAEGCREGANGLGKKADGTRCLSFHSSHSGSGTSLAERTDAYWRAVKGEDGRMDASIRSRPYPIWIINTQGVSANSLWNACSPVKLERTLASHNYEFTPFGYGSGLMGYFFRSNDVPPGRKGVGPRLIPPATLEPLAAVHASGAAVDSAGLSSRRQECAFRLIEQLGNFSLGIRLTNPVFEEQHRAMHRLLPWPLYYFDGDKRSPNSTEIYLSDGGHIDNLGLFSLVRRGVRTIIVFDASQDKKGQFDDLRETSKRLEKEGIAVRIEGLCTDGNNLGSPCAESHQYKFDLSRSGKPAASSPLRERFDPRGAKQRVFVGTYYPIGAPDQLLGGRIIYVKSSLPDSWENGQCDPDAKRGFPCATFDYLTVPGKGKDFPNTSTAKITLESSEKLFRAYRDLGTHLGCEAIKYLTTPKDCQANNRSRGAP